MSFPTSGEQTSVLLAVRHPIFLRGLANIFAEHDDFAIVAACLDAFEACGKVRALAPEVCVLDYQLADLSAPDFIRAIHRHCPRTRVLVLTSAAPHESIDLVRHAGASGVFSKTDPPDALLHSLRRVAAGETCFPVCHEAQMGGPPANGELTRREAEIAAYVSAGLASKEVARRLRLSEGTVKVHLSNIYRKIGVCNRTALAYALSRTRDDISDLATLR